MKIPNCPKHLSREMRRFWRDINSDFELQSDALRILEAACTQWDRAAQAREILAREGIVTTDGHRHPATDVEKVAVGLFLRAMRQLGIDNLAAGPIGRPPAGGR